MQNFSNTLDDENSTKIDRKRAQRLHLQKASTFVASCKIVLNKRNTLALLRKNI